MKASRDRLKILTSFDSLITGDELFHVKDLCIHSKLKDGSSSVVPSSRKLHETLLNVKKSTNIQYALVGTNTCTA